MKTSSNRGVRGIIAGFFFATLLSMSPQFHSVASEPPQSLLPAHGEPPRIDIFLNVDGIKGGSTDAAHKNWIDCYSFGQSAGSGLAPCSSALTTPVSFDNFFVGKRVDQATPLLETNMLTGKLIKRVSLEVAVGGQVFYRVELQDVVIASVNGSGAAGTELPAEQVSFAFQKITWQVQVIDPVTGQLGPPVKGGWDVCENKPI